MTRTPIDHVHKEWGGSFKETTLWMRALGYTWKTIAALLKIPFATFRRYRNTYGLNDSKYIREAPIVNPSEERAKELKYKDLTDMMRQYRMEGRTRKELARDLGINSPMTLDKHLPQELKGEYIVTERLRKVRRRNMNKVNRLKQNKRAGDDPLK